MKKLLLIPALMVSTLTFATDYNWEITPSVGYHIPDDDKVIDDSAVVGAALQYNGFDYPIKPEIQYLHTDADTKTVGTPDTTIKRLILNGVYSFDKIENIIPQVKAGVGFENRDYAGSHHNALLNVGAGVKIPQTDNLAIKLEAMRIFNKTPLHDDATILLAGLNYAFGAKAQAPIPAPVDGDDDKDGVLNSIDKCPTTPAGKTVNADGCCPVDGDDDKDGVLNSVDKCPNTSSNVTKVDTEGCAVEVNLHVNFKFDSFEVTQDSMKNIKDFAEFMNERTGYKAEIQGHTDSSGPEAYNKALSDKRAKAVAELIVSEGNVEASRLTSIGKGESEPIADNATKAGRAENRRTVAKIIK